MKEQLRQAFAGLKDGLRELQAAAVRGDLQSVSDGLRECLLAVEELETAVLATVPGEG